MLTFSHPNKQENIGCTFFLCTGGSSLQGCYAVSTGKKWPPKRDVEWYVSEESNACILNVVQYDWDPEETRTTPVGKSVNIYQSARCNIPNDLRLHQHRSENLKPRNYIHCHLDVCQVNFQHQNGE